MSVAAEIAAIAEHAFEDLFIECLGWDRLRSSITATWKQTSLELTAIAQKRGLTVLHSSTHRTVLADRRLLREVQRQVRRSYHEHIIIYSCEMPRKQVWQWVIEQAGCRLRHREHPFFSNDPPKRLIDRIKGLCIHINEEEQTTLLDVLDRVRMALQPENDHNLFARYPTYAIRSDQMAMAMKRGEPGALQAFVQFHIPLARKVSRVLIRWFNMEIEDAEQTAYIGLMEAARRFDPDRGYQFSTYAGHWLHQVCRRYGLKWGLPIYVPPHCFWSCYKLDFREAELLAALGPNDARDRFDAALEAAGVTTSQWRHYQLARHLLRYSDLDRRAKFNFDQPERRSSESLLEGYDLSWFVDNALKSLHPRLAEVIKKRYGIGCQERTLQEIGDEIGLTRERVRQLQNKAEEKLKRILKTNELFCDSFN